jgi:hypothetical protein
LGVDTGQDVYIEDAPTFTMSLASGEQRVVTFVNEQYFLKIKDKIGLTEDEVGNIVWVKQSRLLADSAIKALRHYLRLHK